MTLKLSVLDQSPIRPGTSAAQAIADSIDLVKYVDGLGFSRYWVAEHHSTPAFAGSAPEILIGRLAAETKHIRVGSGGVMLMHYSPFKVAEQFRVLDTLYPGRIDLGVGRAPGGDGVAIRALSPTDEPTNIDSFPYQLDLLRRFLADAQGETEMGIPPNHPYHSLTAMPVGQTSPEIWILGSGMHSAIYAATLGQSFCHAYFINPDEGPRVAEMYRQRFEPSPQMPKPHIAVAVHTLVADTQEEASRLARMRGLWYLRRQQGRPGGFPSQEEAENYPYSEQELAQLKALEARTFAGTAENVKRRLEQLMEDFGANELILVTITSDHQARRRSYQLLAEAFELARPEG